MDVWTTLNIAFYNDCVKVEINSCNSSAQKLPVTPWHTLNKSQSPFNGLQLPTCPVCTLFSPFQSTHTCLPAIPHTCQAHCCSKAFTLSVLFACTFLIPDIYQLASSLSWGLSSNVTISVKCLDEICFPSSQHSLFAFLHYFSLQHISLTYFS